MLNVFCFQYKVCSVEYFLDKMQWYEVNIYIEYLPYSDRPTQDLLRLNAYINAQTHSKKKIKLDEICQFPWDKSYQEKLEIEKKKEEYKEPSKAISNDEAKKLANEMKKLFGEEVVD